MVSIKDRDLYAIAGQEVTNGVIETGLWAKAFADSGGNEAQAKALYLKMRVIDLSSQRDAQQKQLQQQARAQQQRSTEQQKQKALYAKQYEANLRAEKWVAQSTWKRFIKFVFGAIAILWSIGLVLGLLRVLFDLLTNT